MRNTFVNLFCLPKDPELYERKKSWALEWRSVILYSHLLFTVYIICILQIDIRKLTEFESIQNKEIIMFSAKVVLLVLQITMMVVCQCKIEYFMRLIHFQALQTIVMFAVATHLDIIYETRDTIIHLIGLYYFVPLTVIISNECWWVTMPCYLIIQIYPV